MKVYFNKQVVDVHNDMFSGCSTHELQQLQKFIEDEITAIAPLNLNSNNLEYLKSLTVPNIS